MFGYESTPHITVVALCWSNDQRKLLIGTPCEPSIMAYFLVMISYHGGNSYIVTDGTVYRKAYTFDKKTGIIDDCMALCPNEIAAVNKAITQWVNELH